MRTIKTASYKKQISQKLFDWHGGQWSAVYSVASSWSAMHDVPNDVIENAISELNDELKLRKKEPKRFVSSPEGWEEFEQSLSELEMLMNALREEMKKEELFDNEDDINLNLMDSSGANGL